MGRGPRGFKNLPMFGKTGPDLPRFGKSIGRARDVFCQCLAKPGGVCQALASGLQAAADSAGTEPGRRMKTNEKSGAGFSGQFAKENRRRCGAS